MNAKETNIKTHVFAILYLASFDPWTGSLLSLWQDFPLEFTSCRLVLKSPPNQAVDGATDITLAYKEPQWKHFNKNKQLETQKNTFGCLLSVRGVQRLDDSWDLKVRVFESDRTFWTNHPQNEIWTTSFFACPEITQAISNYSGIHFSINEQSSHSLSQQHWAYKLKYSRCNSSHKQKKKLLQVLQRSDFRL